MTAPAWAAGAAAGTALPVVDYLPVATTMIALAFSAALFRRWGRRQSGPHLLWWAVGVLVYGVGTYLEASVTLFGWQEWRFRAWYISGALMGGAPLAQGTAYLLLARRTANRLTVALVAAIAVASSFALLNPIDYSLVEPHRLTGGVFEWGWARAFSPFINLYAFVLLVGGAALSAWRFSRKAATRNRFLGNLLIAVGALLPGIGGTATRFGHTEVLYVTELVGLVLIYFGYRQATIKSAGLSGERSVELPDGKVDVVAS